MTLLTQAGQIDGIDPSREFWIGKSSPNFASPGRDDIRRPFPTATILPEKRLGMPESIMGLVA